MVLFYAKIFSKPIKYFLNLSRQGVDSLCDPVSSQANYNYLQHKAAHQVSWCGPGPDQNC